MDKLKAYEILELQPESSIEDVKEAYAVLAKRFHQEEHPDEFQQIYEAYTTLVRGNRRRKGITEEEIDDVKEIKNVKEIKDTKQDKRLRGFRKSVQNAEVKEETIVSTYDFESVLDKAKQEEAQQIQQTIVQALNEFRKLLMPEYKEKLKLFKSFFEKNEYAEVLKNAEFIEGLAKILEDSRLKKGIYDYIIDFYRLRGYEENKLPPEAAALYRILDKKRGMNTKKKENLAYAIPAGIVAGVWAGFRSAIRASQVMATLLICVIVIILLFRLYRKLYENHSSIFSQFIIATVIAVCQYAAIMTDFYGEIFGTIKNGNMFAGYLMLASLAWIAVLGLVFLIGKIRGLKKQQG